MSGPSTTTGTTTNWDVSAFPPARSHAQVPTLPKRRGQSHPGSDHTDKRARQSSDTPFPRRSTSRDSSGHERMVSRGDAQRTVRRKKSSLDLRDIFLNGGLIPAGPSATA
ncbi:hypothetical protein K466DRAFT_547139 [Polyporus arcularius HHB13444]|uniref:Uncharacterized protein n=2 Tax=Polyporaceae TaxID=5317 RepID=A0A5C3PJP9_9APHY|nr:hypothetical protein OH76DRAFT_1405030 [Polyporus brumalis]TFK88440.1 hypothetical protein K466DRAFT_547139 [Polyporus arcularius HHB13444]